MKIKYGFVFLSLLVGCSGLTRQGNLTSTPQKSAEEVYAEFEKSHPAPAGYKWKEFKNLAGYFLVPDGWFVLEESTDKGDAGFISREEIKGNSNFLVGVSINSQRKKFKAPLKAKSAMIEGLEIAKKMKAKGEIIEVNPGGDGKYMSGLNFQVVTHGAESEKIHMAIAYLINLKSGTEYIVIAEAPEREWEAERGNIYKIMETLGFNPFR